VLWGNNHNYLEIIIDDNTPYRIQTTGKTNVISVPAGLADTEHTVMICKDTESNIGYIDIVGVRCERLLSLPPKPKRKIEYYGDSITSGTGMDLSVIPCDKGQWYDQHNAYMSYGARTSRNLNAQWQLTALAGVGLIHSCCNMNVVMPQIFDKAFLRNDTIAWNFNKYQPDIVTICLGQNDGPQDSTRFCTAYVNFINSIRHYYPKADIICLSSPMADAKLIPVLKRYLTAITAYMNAHGDKKVYKYFFSRRYHNGCGGHPDMDDHRLIANELTACIKQLKGW
jgi:lysophospholipase L1-like esterase